MRYRIRDLAWLALAIGLALGWYADRSALFSQRNSLHLQRDALAVRLDEIEERTGTDFDLSLTFDEVIQKDFTKNRAASLEALLSDAQSELQECNLEPSVSRNEDAHAQVFYFHACFAR